MRETPEQQRIRLYKKRLTLYDDTLIKCPECELSFAKLGSHVVQVHGYATAKEFRKAYGMDWRTGKNTTIKSYRELKSKLVKSTKNINNLKKGVNTRFKKSGVSSELIKEYWTIKKQQRSK